MASQIEILNDTVHRDLRMRADLGEQHPHFVPIVLGEFPAAASSCPIFLAKDSATGQFYAAALFGFEQGEVLVEGAEAGKAPFRPLELQRRGFFISGPDIAIDTANSRFGAGATIALFDDDGGPSNALRRIQRVLGELTAGFEATRAFIQEMLRLRLVEPIDISLQFDDGKDWTGLYTISRDSLGELPDEDVLALFREQYLQAAMCMTFSLNQVAVLAGRRNERLLA